MKSPYIKQIQLILNDSFNINFLNLVSYYQEIDIIPLLGIKNIIKNNFQNLSLIIKNNYYFNKSF